MKPTAPLALALCLTLPLSAFSQQAASSPGTQPFTDPANLRGERVSPLNGHELPIDQGALPASPRLLRKLNTRASHLLNIVAHPDDEDGGMLTLYARGFGARVSDLALTRGEGGQNFMTGDFEDALGLIRTQELLANDRYTGVSQMFGTEGRLRLLQNQGRSLRQVGPTTASSTTPSAPSASSAPLVIAATFIGERDGWSWPASGLRQKSPRKPSKPPPTPTSSPTRSPKAILPLASPQNLRPRPLRRGSTTERRLQLRHRPIRPRALHQLRHRRRSPPPPPNADVQVPEGYHQTRSSPPPQPTPQIFRPPLPRSPNTPSQLRPVHPHRSRPAAQADQQEHAPPHHRRPTTPAIPSTAPSSATPPPPQSFSWTAPSSKVSVILTEARHRQ